MASDSDYENAARTLPSRRSADQQELVNKAHSLGKQAVKNLDHEARREERIFGSNGDPKKR